MTDDYSLIREDVRRRGITRLCHFTPARKLMNMLHETQAILPTSELLEHHRHLLDSTDEKRLDGRLDHISCSVQYPNAGYFQKVRNDNPNFPDWVILALSPRLLWERPVLFCPRNASAERGGLQQPGWGGWQLIFQPSVRGAGGQDFTRGLQMPHNCPTDNQAEVLVPGRIPLSDITAIILPSQQALEEEQHRFAVMGVSLPVAWRVAPALFSTAFSWGLRAGRIPQEQTVIPSSDPAT